MKVTQVNEVRGRGLVVTVSEPIRGITPGWVLAGPDDQKWSVSFVEMMGGAMRSAKVVGLGLVPQVGSKMPKVGDELVVHPNRVPLR